MFDKERKGDLKNRRLLNINRARNFCRNPNNDIGGPWCSTRDPEVEYELCQVPDCDRPFASTILLTTNSKHKTYIKPLWRINGFRFWLKRWDGKREAGLQITVLNEDLTTYFQIQIGAENATKLLLMYKRGNDEPIMIEKLAPYDFYILSAESWTGYHLTLRPDRLVFGFTESHDPLFNWSYETLDQEFGHGIKFFSPRYLIFEKINAGVLAMSFESQDSFVEIVSQGRTGTFYPMNMWKLSTTLPVEEVTYNFRGTGTAVISFYNVISLGPEMKLSIGGGTLLDSFLSEMTMNGALVSLAVAQTPTPTITNDQWTEIKLKLSEGKVTVYYQGQELVSWSNPRPLLPYYFDIEITAGNMIWILNEYPPDLDSPPVNGAWTEWGAWNCSVSCGGGRGYRRRACAAPAPNLFGLPCEGEDIVYGLCNTYCCGDITPEVTSVINYRLKHYYFTQSLRSGIDSVSVTCYPDILELVQEQTPSYLVYWEKNGQPLSEKKPVNRIQPDRFNYFKWLSTPNDTGIYSCSLQSPLIKHRPIKFISVIVKTEFLFTHVAFRGDKFKFRCNNAIISALYDNLEQMWLHNGKVSKRYTEKYLPMLNTMELELKTQDTGVWECIIHSQRFNMKWQTNWLRLQVKYRSDFVKYLMEDNDYTKIMFKNFDDPTLVLITFSILVVAVFLVTIFVTFILVLCQRALTKKIRKMYKDLIINLEIEEKSYNLEMEPVSNNIESEIDNMKNYRRSNEQIKRMLEEVRRKLNKEDMGDSIEFVPVRVNDESESAEKHKYRYSINSENNTKSSDSHTSNRDSIVRANQSEFSPSPVIERQGYPDRTSDQTTLVPVLDKQSPQTDLPHWKTSLGPVHDRKRPSTGVSGRKTTISPVQGRQGPLTRVSNGKTSISPISDEQSPLTCVSDRKNPFGPVFGGLSPPFRIFDVMAFISQAHDRQSIPVHLFGSRSSRAYGSERQTLPALPSSNQGSPNLRSDSHDLPITITKSQGFLDDLSDIQAFYEGRRKIKLRKSQLRCQDNDCIPKIDSCPGKGSPKTLCVQQAQVMCGTVCDKSPLKPILKMHSSYIKPNLIFKPRRRVSFSNVLNIKSENCEETIRDTSITMDLLCQPCRLSNTKGHYSWDYCSSCKNKITDFEIRNRDDEDLRLLIYEGEKSVYYKNLEDSSGSPCSKKYFFSPGKQVNSMMNFRLKEESSISSSSSCHMHSKVNIYTDKEVE